MAKDDYMPNDDEGRARLFVRFRDGIGPYLPALGLPADQPEIVAQAADATRFRALLDFAITMQKAAKAWTAQKDLELDGRGNVPAELAVPTPGADFPAPVAPGIVKRFRRLVKWIKALEGYNEAMGKGLGVEGVVAVRPDLTAVQPQLELALIGGRVEVLWGWQGLSDWLDQIEIQVDRGEGEGFILLTQDTTPGYVDTAPLPATATTWKYRAIYLLDDHLRVGKWSKEAKINVGG